MIIVQACDKTFAKGPIEQLLAISKQIETARRVPIVLTELIFFFNLYSTFLRPQSNSSLLFRFSIFIVALESKVKRTVIELRHSSDMFARQLSYAAIIANPTSYFSHYNWRYNTRLLAAAGRVIIL